MLLTVPARDPLLGEPEHELSRDPRELRIIVLLSVALVIATAVAVSWTARAMGMESHAAAVLGAVLSPTDAAAVAGLAKQLPRRSVTVLKAESLINDGTALVLFAVTVHVAIGGAQIGPADLVVRFIGSYLGGIAAGLLVGVLVTLVRKRIDAPQEEGALSLLTPFAAFLLAQTIDCSGVVAVMVSALVLAYSGPMVIRARSRLQSFAFWDIATFLLNGSLWVFVGVQIPGAMRGISTSTAECATPYSLPSPSPASCCVADLLGRGHHRAAAPAWTAARCSATVASAGVSVSSPPGRDSVAPCRLPRRWPSRRKHLAARHFPTAA